MRKQLLSVMVFCLVLFCQQVAFAQQSMGEKVKKIRILPVYLVNTSPVFDSAFNASVKEAFTRHSIKLIGRDEFVSMNKREEDRIVAKLLLLRKTYKTESEVYTAIQREQRFVSNFLKLVFISKMDGDSLVITGATWEATPFPRDKHYTSSGNKKITLTDTCCSIKDNVFAIVEMILASKWLR